MFRLILLSAFIAVPIIEIALFIQVGGWIGLWPTLAVIVLTAVLGTALLRQQGLAVLAEARRDLDAGRMPVARIADGLCLLVAAVLLLTPGFMTDALGFLLFVPAVRQAIGRGLLDWFRRHGRVDVRTGGTAGRRPAGTGPQVIEGEAVEITTEKSGKEDKSKWTQRH